MKALWAALVILAVVVFLALVVLGCMAIWYNDSRYGGLAILAFFVCAVFGIAGGLGLSFAGGNK